MCTVLPVDAAELAHAKSGYILLQVEENGEAWYVNPENKLRYYLGRPHDALSIMRELGLGISNENLALIPTASQSWDGDHATMARVRGKILLQVEEHGEAWYVSPQNGKRYFLGTPEDALNVMRARGVGITNNDLLHIPKRTDDTTDVSPTSGILLDVPFIAQAPTGNWSEPFNEACEETVLLQLDYYKRDKDIAAETFENEIRDVVAWQKQEFGFWEDTSAKYTATMAREYFGLDASVSYTVSAKKIRRELRAGNPVIVPVYGPELDNPYFVGTGPLYHVVLIIGYEGGDFIVNEPGTRRGGQYRYSESVLMNAIHDLELPEANTKDGRKAMVVISL